MSRLSGSHAGQLFSSGFLWDMGHGTPYVVFRVFYLYEFVLMSDKRESGEEGGKKRERKAMAEDLGKRIRLKREPKEEPKEAKDPEVKDEDEEMASSSALPAHAPAPAPAPAPPPPDPPAPPAPIPAFPVDVFAHDMYDVRARREEGSMSVVDLGDRPQGVISLHLGVSRALWRDIPAPQRQAVVRAASRAALAALLQQWAQYPRAPSPPPPPPPVL